MKYPMLTELGSSRELIDVFGGYNHNLRIGEGEFYDMTNLTSSNYPVLSPRPPRGVYIPTGVENASTPLYPLGLIAKDALCYVEGRTTTDNKGNVTVFASDFYINGYKVYGDLSPEPKTLISMGAYVIIMPDKVYINTNDYSDKGKIEADIAITSGTVTFEMCKLDGSRYSKQDGTEYETIPRSTTAPTDPANMDLWIDTSSTPHVLKQYASTTKMWTSVATTYIKITLPSSVIPSEEGGLKNILSANDGVTISGITDSAVTDLNNTMVVWDVGTDYIVVIGMLDEIVSQQTEENPKDKYGNIIPFRITRRMPNMDFIIESGNRLWGCRYGAAVNGEIVNEIYASKLGDFKNWNCFAGISTDSYAATVGTDGKFTGATTHLGYPLFFKENCIHKVYGNYPANYQIQTITCRGVQDGCSKSLAIVNEVLYYKSRSGICAYDGSLPAEMSSALGEMTYSDAVAGSIGNKYYISMKDANGDYNLFVYDAARVMWHREDDTQVTEFCNCRGDLYYIDSDRQIKTVLGTGIKDTSAIKWKAITGVIGTGSPDKKYISRLVVRLSLEIGTSVVFSVEYDSSGEWEHLFTMSGVKLSSFSVPIRPKRCDHLRLRIEGKGVAKIYSICKTIEQGSDV